MIKTDDFSEFRAFWVYFYHFAGNCLSRVIQYRIHVISYYIYPNHVFGAIIIWFASYLRITWILDGRCWWYPETWFVIENDWVVNRVNISLNFRFISDFSIFDQNGGFRTILASFYHSVCQSLLSVFQSTFDEIYTNIHPKYSILDPFLDDL